MDKYRQHWFPGSLITLALAAPALISFDAQASIDKTANRKALPLQELEISSALKAAEDQLLANIDNNGAAVLTKREESAAKDAAVKEVSDGFMINFNNIKITEYIRFISKISGKNFIFDERDLNFNVTIVSEALTNIDDIMAALVQNLRIKGLTLLEQGNNLIVHNSKDVSQASKVVTDGNPLLDSTSSEFITRVFRVSNVSPDKMSDILRPMLSKTAILEVLKESQHIVVTDLISNLPKLAELVTILDSPHSGYEIGQYSSMGTTILPLVALAEKIMTPIAADKTLVFIPHAASSSIYVVSTPYLVEKTLSILQTIDKGDRKTRMLSFENMQFAPEDQPPSPVKKNAEMRMEEPITFTLQPDGPYIEQRESGGEVSFAHSGAFEERKEEKVGYQPKEDRFDEQASIIKGPPRAFEERSEEEIRFREGVPKQLEQRLEDTITYRPQLDGSVQNLEWKENLSSLSIAEPALIRPELQEKRFEEEPFVHSLPHNLIEERHEDLVEVLAPGEEIDPAAEAKRLERLRQAAKEGSSEVPLATDSDFSTSPRMKLTNGKWTEEVPFSDADSTLFYVYKLEFRGGEQIESALRRIGSSLKESRRGNMDLMAALTSVQLIPSSNSLIFSGSPNALPRMVELIQSMDVPLRQVLIEVLVLDTSINDSVNFGVGSALQSSFSKFGISTGYKGAPVTGSFPRPIRPASINENPPVGNLTSNGFYAGAVGKIVHHAGKSYTSIGGLLNAMAGDTKTNIIMNPKIVTEDNSEAQIFIGLTTRFQTNAQVNENAIVVTNNYEYRDVGSTLTVRPLIGNNDLITLEITQEISSVDSEKETASTSTKDLGPTTNRSLTKTKVHLPNKFFLMMSGMIQDESVRTRNQLPCLGSIPMFGSLVSDSSHRDNRRNLMIFIRPQILDTALDMEEVTQKAQEEFREKSLNNFETYQKERMREILKIKDKNSKAKAP